jgi:hypothetical protein
MFRALTVAGCVMLMSCGVMAPSTASAKGRSGGHTHSGKSFGKSFHGKKASVGKSRNGRHHRHHAHHNLSRNGRGKVRNTGYSGGKNFARSGKNAINRTSGKFSGKNFAKRPNWWSRSGRNFVARGNHRLPGVKSTIGKKPVTVPATKSTPKAS